MSMMIETSDEIASGDNHSGRRTSRIRPYLRKAVHSVYDHTLRHTGVGIVCAVAYFDPYVGRVLVFLITGTKRMLATEGTGV